MNSDKKTASNKLRGSELTTRIGETSPLIYARVAGILFLIMVVAALLAT